MIFITFLKHQKIVFYSLFGALFLASCGSYQYVGMSDDGIYGSSENGDYVECAVSGKKINLENLTYWNVELQEPYFSYKEASEKREKKNK